MEIGQRVWALQMRKNKVGKPNKPSQTSQGKIIVAISPMPGGNLGEVINIKFRNCIHVGYVMSLVIFGVYISRDKNYVRVEIQGFPSTLCLGLTTAALTCCRDDIVITILNF